MILLHTSDWHIGRILYGHRRYGEHERFLSWLVETIRREQVEILLIAGDIFDNGTPGNHAQELYYRFLIDVTKTTCRHVVITAGNHDSPSFLDAPGDLLRTLDIHVVGAVTEKEEDEVLLLRDRTGKPELVACAVPYLRERDVRRSEAGESDADKERNVLDGIRRHYAEVSGHAAKLLESLNQKVPLVVMGHLFAAGGRLVDGDGVRDLYVGSLAKVDAGIFPESADYVALGHLHVPQKVQGRETVRYSGSPLPMGFGEARQAKSLVRVSIGVTGTDVSLLPIPVFQTLERIAGDWTAIESRIRALAEEDSHAWLEVDYAGEEIPGMLRERLDAAIEGTSLEILRVRNERLLDQALRQQTNEETLDDLSPREVFERCLVAHGVEPGERPSLIRAHDEILHSIHETDGQSET